MGVYSDKFFKGSILVCILYVIFNILFDIQGFITYMPSLVLLIALYTVARVNKNGKSDVFMYTLLLITLVVMLCTLIK